MNLSNYFKNAVINHMLRNQAFTPPTTLYLALFTVGPDATGGGTEVTGGAYARQVFSLDAPTAGVTQNAADIIFPTPTANWGVVTHAAVFDAITVGNMILYGSLVTAKTALAGNPFKVLDGDFDFSLT